MGAGDRRASLEEAVGDTQSSSSPRSRQDHEMIAVLRGSRTAVVGGLTGGELGVTLRLTGEAESREISDGK